MKFTKQLITERIVLNRAMAYVKFCMMNEQAGNVPMPPMLAGQLQQQKNLLQQVLSGSAQKGTAIQASPVVNDYIQYATKAGLFQGGDINKILSGFDQFFLQKNQENLVATQLKPGQGKAGVVAPPTTITNALGNKPSLVTTLPGDKQFDPQDPFGLKANQERVKMQKDFAARKAKADADQIEKAKQADFEKKLAAKRAAQTVNLKEGKLAELIFQLLFK